MSSPIGVSSSETPRSDPRDSGVHGDKSFHSVPSTAVRGGGGGPITSKDDPKVKTSSQNNCKCMKWVAGALLAAGVVATLFGVLAIMGSSLPTVPFFQDVAAITSNIGAQLGTDAWTISILTTSLGAAMMIGGAFWTASVRWSRNEYKRLTSEDTSLGAPHGGRPASQIDGDHLGWSSTGSDE
ncbi:MAG: hypothetical protein K1000chlam4_00644 [Chlamydiae bacterium]|nr:hypothetical protein [Chlamydiota bacterium]